MLGGVAAVTARDKRTGARAPLARLADGTFAIDVPPGTYTVSAAEDTCEVTVAAASSCEVELSSTDGR